MYVLLLFALACVLGWTLWRGLRQTTLHPLLCAVLTSACVIILFVILFWSSVYASLIVV